MFNRYFDGFITERGAYRYNISNHIMVGNMHVQEERELGEYKAIVVCINS